MKSLDTTQRFLRPADADRTRRNHRQIRTQKALVASANLVLLTLLVGGGVWLYRRTQQDIRFAVKQVQMLGAKQTPKATLEEISARYVGQNLFRIDLDGLRRDLGALPWVSRIEIEKKLPDRLLVHIIERRPVALAVQRGVVRYVDEGGSVFADLSPASGNPELPLVRATTEEEMVACVRLVVRLRREDPLLFDSVSEVRFQPPGHFVIFDRQLRTVIFAESESVSERWRTLRQILSAEGQEAAIEYADLRFNDRIIVKSVESVRPEPIRLSVVPAAITN